MTMPCFKTGISTRPRLLAAVLVVLAAGVAVVVAARPTDWSPAVSGQAPVAAALDDLLTKEYPRGSPGAALTLAKPYQDPVAVALPEKDLDALVGVYANAWKEEFFVWKDGMRMFISGPELPRMEVFPLSASIFFPKDSLSRVEFVRDVQEAATAVKFIARVGPVMSFGKTAKPLPSGRKVIALDPKVFDQYAGEYEIAAGFTITFFRDGGKFMTQATGQAAFEIFPESETKFFLKVVDGQVEFVKDAAGKVTGMVMTQSGRTIPGKKIKRLTE